MKNKVTYIIALQNVLMMRSLKYLRDIKGLINRDASGVVGAAGKTIHCLFLPFKMASPSCLG
ncbi:MAG: hypothetical protein JST17_06360 [Bacteroidetes bacterium]|nr:hypothetical protein [Bacteroidota bacterium]MBS1929818.1 hypothetical protein [Bacteroidota bacterium]